MCRSTNGLASEAFHRYAHADARGNRLILVMSTSVSNGTCAAIGQMNRVIVTSGEGGDAVREYTIETPASSTSA
ncbi:MAG: hypothetical protein K2Q20_13490 [Phycisphaerales bacterium]|nr:hypothetical protein [Phycisphaerales bacterium]